MSAWWLMPAFAAGYCVGMFVALIQLVRSGCERGQSVIHEQSNPLVWVIEFRKESSGGNGDGP